MLRRGSGARWLRPAWSSRRATPGRRSCPRTAAASARSSSTATSCWSPATRTSSAGAATRWCRSPAGSAHGRFAFRGVRAPAAAGDAAARDPRRGLRPAVARSTTPATLSIDLDERWPYRGRVVQRFALDEDGADVRAHARGGRGDAGDHRLAPVVPARRSSRGDPPVVVDFAADEMLVRDAEGMPSGERVTPPPGPWDDAFTGVQRRPRRSTWPGRLRLRLSSTCPWWVVYTEPEHARVRRAPERAAGRASTGRRRSSSPARRSCTRCAGAGTACALIATGAPRSCVRWMHIGGAGVQQAHIFAIADTRNVGTVQRAHSHAPSSTPCDAIAVAFVPLPHRIDTTDRRAAAVGGLECAPGAQRGTPGRTRLDVRVLPGRSSGGSR